MGVLQRFEGRLDQLVNGAFARAFRSEVQPVEVAAALQRELDDRSAVVSRDSTMAPNVFTVELGASDHERLTPYAQALNAEFAAMVTEHAQAQGYTLIGPVEVTMVRVADLGTGLSRVSSASQAGVVAQPQVRPPLITEPAASPQPASSPAPEPALTTNARLVINDTGFPLTTSVVTIGRGSDAGIRIDDPGISRHHAEITFRHGRFHLAALVNFQAAVMQSDGQRRFIQTPESGET